MNHTIRHMLPLSGFLLVGASLFLTGCGPENFEDVAAIEAKDEETRADMNMRRPMHQNGMHQNGMHRRGAMRHGDRGDRAQGAFAPQAVGAPGAVSAPGAIGAPGAVAPVEGVAAVPVEGVAAVPVAPVVPVVALPDQYVRHPDTAVLNPPIVTNTGEQRLYNQRVFHEQENHIHSPMINQHLITNNLNTEHLYHTTVVNHSSFRNDVAMVNTATQTAAILPTTEIVTPTVVLPGIVAPVAPILPVPIAPLYDLGWGAGAPPFCAPYLSGGFYRNCWPAGPYWR